VSGSPAFNEAAIVEKEPGRPLQYMESLEDEYHWEIVFVNDEALTARPTRRGVRR